jgi:GT2 family glycosyltransferase
MSREAVSALRNPGQFYDERFPVFWNDVDMAMRASSAGIQFALVPSANVIHNLGHSVRDLNVQFVAMLFWSRAGMMGFADKWKLHKRTIQTAMFLDAVFSIAMTMASLFIGRRTSGKRPVLERVKIIRNVISASILRFRCSLR